MRYSYIKLHFVCDGCATKVPVTERHRAAANTAVIPDYTVDIDLLGNLVISSEADSAATAVPSHVFEDTSAAEIAEYTVDIDVLGNLLIYSEADSAVANVLPFDCCLDIQPPTGFEDEADHLQEDLHRSDDNTYTTNLFDDQAPQFDEASGDDTAINSASNSILHASHGQSRSSQFSDNDASDDVSDTTAFSNELIDNPPTSAAPIVLKTNKGNIKLSMEGYMYTVHSNKDKDCVRWRCAKRLLRCTGAISTDKEYGNVRVMQPHNHPPDHAAVDIVKCRNKMKEAAKKTKTPTSLICSQALCAIPVESRRELPAVSTMKRTIRNNRTLNHPAVPGKFIACKIA